MRNTKKVLRDQNRKLENCCADCSKVTIRAGDMPNNLENYYMVQNALWEQFGVGCAVLCVTCLEARVGRRLRWSDFPECPLNTWHLDKYGQRYEIDVLERPRCTYFGVEVTR